MGALRQKIVSTTLELLAIFCLVWAFYPLLFINDLGHTALIPTHYNFQGQVDGYGELSSLWGQPIIALVLYGVFSILVRYPEKLNYPIKVTKENADSLYRLAINMLKYVKVVCMLILAYGSNLSFEIAIGENVGKNHYGVVVLMGLMFIIVLYYVLKMLKCK